MEVLIKVAGLKLIEQIMVYAYNLVLALMVLIMVFILMVILILIVYFSLIHVG
jgi:hypothetical protein